jgi:SAM-dependent methyltransferase
MPTERVIEIPWVLSRLPQTGLVLDVGSCDASYLFIVQQTDRELHCMDPRGCGEGVPGGARFFCESIIGNSLPADTYDAVMFVSVIEHIGLPCYGQKPFPSGDVLALAEAWRLLRPEGRVLVTLPAGCDRITSWYRQYSPGRLHKLFHGWTHSVTYWGYQGGQYVEIPEDQVERHDYRDTPYVSGAGAGACALVEACRK